MGTLQDIHKIQEKADRIMAHKGNEKGLGIINERNTYLKKVGKEGLQKIERGMEELGYPFSYDEVKSFSWYDASYLPLSILVASHLLEWEEEDIYAFGKLSATQSSVLRTALSFVSMKVAYNNVSRLWGTHFDFGKMEGVEYNKKEKNIRLRVHDYRFGGITVKYLQGYFAGFINRVVEGEPTVIYEGVCDSETENEFACDKYFLDWQDK